LHPKFPCQNKDFHPNFPELVIQTTEKRCLLIDAPSPKGSFSAIEKKIRIKLEYFSSTKLLIPIVRMYNFKLEGGEWFKGVFANFLR